MERANMAKRGRRSSHSLSIGRRIGRKRRSILRAGRARRWLERLHRMQGHWLLVRGTVMGSNRISAVHIGDIAMPATGEAVVKTAVDRFGHLDVLFNNAGIFTPKPFLEVDEVEYDRFVDVILK